MAGIRRAGSQVHEKQRHKGDFQGPAWKTARRSRRNPGRLRAVLKRESAQKMVFLSFKLFISAFNRNKRVIEWGILEQSPHCQDDSALGKNGGNAEASGWMDTGSTFI
jgi:hypothetical protein